MEKEMNTNQYKCKKCKKVKRENNFSENKNNKRSKICNECKNIEQKMLEYEKNLIKYNILCRHHYGYRKYYRKNNMNYLGTLNILNEYCDEFLADKITSIAYEMIENELHERLMKDIGKFLNPFTNSHNEYRLDGLRDTAFSLRELFQLSRRNKRIEEEKYFERIRKEEKLKRKAKRNNNNEKERRGRK